MIVVDDKANIVLIYPHPKRIRATDDIDLPIHKALLTNTTRSGTQPSVICASRDILLSQSLRQSLGFGPRCHIDDPRTTTFMISHNLLYHLNGSFLTLAGAAVAIETIDQILAERSVGMSQGRRSAILSVF